VPEPTNPVYPPIYGINLQYLLPLPFGESYNWRLVAKNSCLETPGPVQTFSLRDLPDLEPFDLQVPASTFAGQNFNLSWKVKNQGSGGTGSQNWLELVFLSPDSVLGDDIAIGYADNLAYLNAGQSYTQVVSLPISPALFGSFYVFVVTDIQGGQGLVQETDEFNNFVRNPGPPIQIVPPPLPDLEVLALSAPSNIFSGNEITVNWTIENIGDADALSDRKKRNFTLNGCIWEERIWYDGIYLSQDSILDQSDILIKEAEVALRSMAYGGGVLCGNIGNWLAVPDYLSVDSSYSMSLGALVPHTLSGTWYVILEQDRRNDIVNNGFAAKYGVSGPVTITLSPPPDLVVSAVNPPPAIESGTSVSISWSVMNQGSNAPFEKTWTDRVYLSKLSTFNIDSTIYLGALSHYNGDQLGAGQSYSAGKSFPIPGWINGNYYVYVHTDATQKVFEFTFDGNNIGRSSSAVAIMPGDRPDLKVTQIILPDTLWAGEYFSIQWTVQNLGPKTTSGNWFDKIYLSSDTVWDPASDRLIHSQSVSLALTQGQKSTQSATFRLPADANSPYTLFVYTDATNKVFEETENNNLAAHSDFIPSGPVLIPRIPTESDLEIISFNPATSLNSGKDLTVSWTVQNTGTSATNLASWYDKLFLSQDLIPDGQDFTLLNSGKSGGLLSGALYQTQGTFRVPDGLSGAWYLLLSVDHGKTSGDTILANHFSAIPVNISLSPPPDLVVQGFTVPDTLIAGQTLAVSFSIKNTGTGDLLSSDPDWIDALYLSSTPDLSGTPVHLGSRSRMTGLAVDSSYTVNMNVVIPAWLSGFYYCIARTDKTDKVYEDAGESNNLAFELVEIIIPDPSDLVVTRLELPDSVKLGETISVQYTLQNNGANPALGNLRDALYFSLDSVYDGSLDLLIRSFESNINIGPSDTLSRLLTAQIRDANPGDYHGIMRTNLLNTVNETDLDNNLRIDPDKITVDVAELFLSVPDTQALNEGDVLYYRLNVPADLDLILRLFSNKTIGSNSVYVAYNRIPTLFDYDFRNPDPQSVDQEILIAGTTAGDYYIMVRTASAFSNQEVELIAEGLPFSLLTIDPNEVGQGIVTTHIRGAGFRDSMQVFLKDNGLVVATATRVILESSMEAQIKWDLENVSSGTYDVAAVNPDLSEVLLLDGLQVEPSTGIRVSFFPIVPNALRKGRTGFYSFFLRNTGNVDADFVQADISFPIEAFVQSLSISGEVMTRTEMGQGEFQEDYLETAKLKIIPLWVHDLSPGEEVAIGAMLGGFNRTPFPVRLRVNATNTQSFIQQQLGNLETFRLGILNDPVNYPFGPDVVNLAGDPIAFRDTMLTGYFQLGIFSPEDTIGMNLNCTVCTGPSGVTAIAGEFDFNPGNSPGKLSLLTAEFGSGGTFLCEINRYEGTAGEDPGWDQIEVSGALTITADAFNPFVIHLASLDYYGLPDYLAGWHPAVDVCWPVVSAQGGINGFDPNTVILNTDLFTQFNETYGGTFSLELSDPNTISVCFTAYQPGPGEAGVPGAPGAPCECGSPGGPGGDGDGSTPPGNGGAGGQGGPGNVDCEPGDGGPGGAGGNGGNGQQGGNGGAGGEGGVGSDGQDGGNGGMGGDGGQGGSDADGGNGGEGGAGGQGGEGANGGSGGIGGQGGNGSGSGNGGSGGGGGIGGFGGGGGIGGTGGGGGTGGDKGPSGMDDGDSGTSGDDGSMGAKEAKCNDREKRTQQTLQKICNVAFTTTGCGIAGAGCAAGMASCATILGCPVGLALCGLGLFGCAYGIVGSVTELPDGPGDVGCIGVADYVNCVAQKVICNNVLRPCDPNDIAGPEGYGAEGFVAKTEVMPYLIRFENESGVGNAAAQRVSIHLPIDADLNPLSFRLGNFGFGNWVFQVPAGVSNYNTVLDLRDPYGLLVEVTAGLDIVNNELIWVFQSVDPGTSLPPANPFAGFLPVNDSTGAGEGFATFTIKPKSTAQTGDSITAQAGIIFDINDPVITNTALNLIDAEPPMTSVAGLPDSTYQTTFEVQITGADDPGGSGIQEYALYVSEDSSNFLLHEAGLIQPSVLFTGLPGKTYRFFSVSTDFVGNLEGVKTYAEETISIRTDAASCGKDSYEPNDLPALASNLYGGAFSGGKHSRKICPRFDQDWYYVNNQAGGQTLIVRLENLPADYNVYLYQNGIAVDSSVQAGTANDRIEYTAAPAGIYRILVKGAGDAWSATEDYTLIISTMLPAPSGGVKANIKDPIFRDPGMDAFFRVFPNPASDELNCTLFSEIETEGTIILSDPFGREIIREKISLVKGTQSIQWKLPDLAEGMYSISLQTDQEIRSEKVLILHK
jgi:subtilase family serine protease